MTAETCQCGFHPSDDDRECVKCGTSVKGRQIMDEITTGVADVYHGDADAILHRGLSLTSALQQAKADGLVLLVAKCTQGGKKIGKPYVDPRFHEWAAAAHMVGVEFGAYHFMSETDTGEAQADFCAESIKAAGLDPSAMFVACDFERNPNGPTATPHTADAFCHRWAEAYGKPCWFYANQSDLGRAVHTAGVASIQKCPVWLAAYGDFGGNPHAPLPWALWQYMGAECSDPWEFPHDETTYPRSFKGLGKVDRSAFRGTADELLALVRGA